MNRRDFNIRLMALGTAPLAPALPTTAATAAAAPKALSGAALMHYPWAARYARVHDACSPERLAGAFRIAPETAREIFLRLQADGVITAPGLGGLARAANPINWDLQFSPSPAQTARNALVKRVRKALSDHPEAEPPEPGAPPSTAAETEADTGSDARADPAPAQPVRAARETE